jgi:hypothetical protein
MADSALLPSASTFECTVCLQIFLCPTTLRCGHTFCHACVRRSLQAAAASSSSGGAHCPLCRAPLHPDPSRLPAESVVIKAAIAQSFPARLKAVIREQQEEEAAAAAAQKQLPSATAGGWQRRTSRADMQSVMQRLPLLSTDGSRRGQLLFPYQPLRLVVRQPCQIELVEAALEGGGLFGFWGGGGGSTGQGSSSRRQPAGTLVRLVSAEALHSGGGDRRGAAGYTIEGVGLSRFRVEQMCTLTHLHLPRHGQAGGHST